MILHCVICCWYKTVKYVDFIYTKKTVYSVYCNYCSMELRYSSGVCPVIDW